MSMFFLSGMLTGCLRPMVREELLNFICSHVQSSSSVLAISHPPNLHCTIFRNLLQLLEVRLMNKRKGTVSNFVFMAFS